MNIKEVFNPSKTIFVSASAGAGKTTLLVKRFLSLALSGIKLNKILCLTFTRNAAAEMKSRIIGGVITLTMLADHELTKYLYREFAAEQIDLVMVRANLLFILDNPDMLRVETIHSYCYFLVKKFSAELNLPFCCKIIDENESSVLMERALKQVMLMIAQEDEELLQSFYQFFSDRKILDDFKRLASKCYYQIKRPEKLSIVIARIEGLQKQFIRNTTLPSGETPLLLEIHSIFQESNEEIFELLKDVFFTKSNKKRVKLFSKSDWEKYPEVCEKIMVVQEEFSAVYIQCQVLLNEYLQNLYSFILRLLASKFDEMKKQIGKITFDEVIDYCLELLLLSEYRDFVLYDVDHSFDHLMLDEAQDTNYKQWEIVKSLTIDFFSGQSATQVPRSVFVVGDYKQSIYRFQGAEPASFHQAKLYFKQLLPAEDFIELNLQNNYRSGKNIINMVNRICEITSDKISLDELVPQIAQKQLDGVVRLVEYNKDLNAAEIIAGDVKNWLDQARCASGENISIKPSDIMILFRSRNQLYSNVISELDRLGIGSSGDDRLSVCDHLFVKDLLALALFYNNPHDDLNLACILRSPYYKLGDELIEDLCYKREGSLYQNLLARTENPEVQQVLVKISYLLTVDFNSTREFFRKIILQKHFLKTYIGHYGSIIKRLYQVFFNILDGAKASLSIYEFVCYLKSLNLGIDGKTIEENKVRIMTIHAAKGLEANIVILADVKSLSSTQDNYIIHEDKFYYKMDSATNYDDFDAIRNETLFEDQREYFRLGYVAFTRGQNELHLYGAYLEEDSKDSWHQAVRAAVLADENVVRVSMGSEITCYQIGDLGSEREKENKKDEDKRDDFLDIKFPEIDFITNQSPSKKEEQGTSPLSPFYHKVEYGSNYHKLFSLGSVLAKNSRIADKYGFGDKGWLTRNITKFLSEENSYYHELSFAKISKNGYNITMTKATLDLLIKTEDCYEIIEIKSSASAISEDFSASYGKQLKEYEGFLQEIVKIKGIKSYFYFAQDDIKTKEREYVN